MLDHLKKHAPIGPKRYEKATIARAGQYRTVIIPLGGEIAAFPEDRKDLAIAFRDKINAAINEIFNEILEKEKAR